MKKYSTRIIAACTAVGLVSLLAVDAEAQRVRTFDDQAESGESSGSQVAIPGAPAPEPQEQEVEVQEAQPQEAEESGESDRPVGSYQIRVHGGATPGAAGGDVQRLSAAHTELYRGIIPGERDAVAHLSGDDDLNRLTWIGFQPDADKTRVFFQAPDTISYQIQEAFDEQSELVVVFSDAEIAARNFSRFIDASHFGRVIERIETHEEGRDIHVTLKMNQAVEPEVSTDEGYLYFDFPHQSEDPDSEDEDPRADAQ